MKKNKVFEIKKDCFAYNDNLNSCNVLSCLLCAEKKCSFYKEKSKVDIEKLYKDIDAYNACKKN